MATRGVSRYQGQAYGSKYGEASGGLAVALMTSPQIRLRRFVDRPHVQRRPRTQRARGGSCRHGVRLRILGLHAHRMAYRAARRRDARVGPGRMGRVALARFPTRQAWISVVSTWASAHVEASVAASIVSAASIDTPATGGSKWTGPAVRAWAEGPTQG
jgi:hypothetical protein